MNFKRFIGIDWSGAKDPRRGLRIAQCFPGHKVPEIALNGDLFNWRRREVLNWLLKIHNSGERILVGLDFGFAYPYCDKGTYFPGHNLSPDDKAESLWEEIDSICQNAGDFYASPFYSSQDSLFSDYLFYQTYKGKCYSPRMRITEIRSAGIGCRPSTIFKCIGPDSVGIGSLAGMRLLHYTNTCLKKDFLIWPFEWLDNYRSVFVEIFPRLFFTMAGENPQNWQNRNVVNNAFKYFGSDALLSDAKIESEDQIDAIISAAALRHFSNIQSIWHPTALNNCAKTFEGWIFGIE